MSGSLRTRSKVGEQIQTEVGGANLVEGRLEQLNSACDGVEGGGDGGRSGGEGGRVLAVGDQSGEAATEPPEEAAAGAGDGCKVKPAGWKGVAAILSGCGEWEEDGRGKLAALGSE